MQVKLKLGSRMPLVPPTLVAILAMALMSTSTTLVGAPLSSLPTYGAFQNCITDGTGGVHADLHGEVVASLEWGNEGTACTGFTSTAGPVRLQFSRRTDDGELVIDLTIRGVAHSQTGRSFKGSISFGGSALEGATFSTPADACRFVLVENTLVSATQLEHIYKLVGSARCSSPAKADSHESQITIRGLSFTGQTRWSR